MAPFALASLPEHMCVDTLAFCQYVLGDESLTLTERL
jgi:hypothetical protein